MTEIRYPDATIRYQVDVIRNRIEYVLLSVFELPWSIFDQYKIKVTEYVYNNYSLK